MPHTWHSLFPSPGYKMPLPLKMNQYLQAPLRNLAFQLTPVFTLSTSSVSIQMYSGVSVLKQTHSRKVRNTGSFLLREHSLLISQKFDWIFILVFNVNGIKPRAYTCRCWVSYQPWPELLISDMFPLPLSPSRYSFAYLISLFLPSHPIETKFCFWSSCVTLLPSWSSLVGSPHYNKIQTLCLVFTLYSGL